MKFLMNGGLILGSRDGSNLEIEKDVGAQNIFLFGSDKNRLFAYHKFVAHTLIIHIVENQESRHFANRCVSAESL